MTIDPSIATWLSLLLALGGGVWHLSHKIARLEVKQDAISKRLDRLEQTR